MGPNGLLGKAALAANTPTLICTAPAGKSPTVNIRTVNFGAFPVDVELWITTAADINDVTNADLILSTEVAENGVMEDTGIVMGSGEKLVARASAATVTVRAHGFED